MSAHEGDGRAGQEMLTAARAVITREAAAVAQVAEQLGEEFVRTAELLLRCTGKVLVAGMGTSGATARRIAHLLSVSGTPALFVSAADGLHGQLGAVARDDVVLAISKGGDSDELNEYARRAQERGALLVAMTSAPRSTLAMLADLSLVTTTPDDADLGGMIATGSALAHCAIGDALVAVTMSMRERAWEQFRHAHPGGAVGKHISASHGDRPRP